MLHCWKCRLLLFIGGVMCALCKYLLRFSANTSNCKSSRDQCRKCFPKNYFATGKKEKLATAHGLMEIVWHKDSIWKSLQLFFCWWCICSVYIGVSYLRQVIIYNGFIWNALVQSGANILDKFNEAGKVECISHLWQRKYQNWPYNLHATSFHKHFPLIIEFELM